jgi:hypothetical protein
VSAASVLARMCSGHVKSSVSALTGNARGRGRRHRPTVHTRAGHLAWRVDLEHGTMPRLDPRCGALYGGRQRAAADANGARAARSSAIRSSRNVRQSVRSGSCDEVVARAEGDEAVRLDVSFRLGAVGARYPNDRRTESRRAARPVPSTSKGPTGEAPGPTEVTAQRFGAGRWSGAAARAPSTTRHRRLRELGQPCAAGCTPTANDRLVGVDEHRQRLSSTRAGTAVDPSVRHRVPQRSQPFDVAPQGAARHLEPAGELRPGPVAPTLEQGEETHRAGGRVGHGSSIPHIADGKRPLLRSTSPHD